MPEFGSLFGAVGHFMSNAAKVAGREIGHVGSAVQHAGGAVTDAVKKVPVVGAPVHTLFTGAYHAMRAPVDIVVDTAIRGKRIDRAVLGKLHEQMQVSKELAPYASTVVSFVPGVGSGAAGAIGAATALADGQPLDKIAIAAAINAVPGGALAHAAASAAAAGVEAAARGEKFDVNTAAGALINSLPLSPQAKTALTNGIRMTADIAQGKPVSTAAADALLREGMANLPDAAKKAVQTGMAVQAGQILQAAKAAHLPDIHGKLIESGIQLGKSLPVVGEARKLVGSGTRGFDLGHGLLSQKARLFDIMHTRSTLSSPHDLKGFDMALATRIGLVAHPTHPQLSPAAAAGRAITHGVNGMARHDDRAEILTTLKNHPSASVGARVAEKHIVAQHVIWPIKVVRTLGAGARMLLRKM
jgi:hypothetical protein